MYLVLELNVFEISIIMAFVADGTAPGQTLYNRLKDKYREMQFYPGATTLIQLSENSFLRALNAVMLHAPGCSDHHRVFQRMLNTWNEAVKDMPKKWKYDKDGDVIM